MAGNSEEEESDLSDSDIDEYAEKPYEELKTGKLKVKGPNNTFRCPFCAGKKKRDYQYKDLLQHATGTSQVGSSKNAKQKANHKALANYLKNELANLGAEEGESSRAIVISRPEEKGELYCWPWLGIIVNIRDDPKAQMDLCTSNYWLYKLSKYKPQDVKIFRDEQGMRAQAVVRFNDDWTGFKHAMEFEKSFEVRHHSKKEWNTERNYHGTSVYGWFARDDDYKSQGVVGEYLRENGELKTVADLVEEAVQSRMQLKNELIDEMDSKRENLIETEKKYIEQTETLSKLVEEKDQLHRIFCEETKRQQVQVRENVQRVLNKTELLDAELERKKKQLESWNNELEKRQTLTELEKLKLDEDWKKNDARTKALQLASEEQRKTDEKVLRLMENQKREKEAALKKILDLEKNLISKQKLEMEIKELEGTLEVMRQLDQKDEAVKKQIKELKEKLEEKNEDLRDTEALNQTLLAKERRSNDEVQEARKELIKGLSEMLESNSRAIIRIKRMGEIDTKIFIKECNKRFPKDPDRLFKSATACSEWQDKFTDSNWYPFKNVLVSEETYEKVLDENDELLQKLKAEWGKNVYIGVTNALKEMDEYNSSGRYPVPELWNFKENRKATSKEIISFLCSKLKPLKRRPRPRRS